MFGFWFFESGMSFLDLSARLAASVVAVIWFLPLHEVAHLWMAGFIKGNRFNFKSVMLSDFFDPFGAICMILFNYGWAKSFYFSQSSYSKKEKVLIALAGPVFNFLSAIFAGFALNILMLVKAFFLVKLFWISKFLTYILNINVILMVFNLIPVPPLDGFKILEAMIPGKYLSRYQKNYVPISIVLTLLMLFGFFSYPLGILENAVYRTVLLISGLPFVFIKSL
jgi:Zn-dependent protease